ETLATSVQKVFTNLRNGSDVGPGVSHKLVFNKRELRRNELVNVLGSHLHTASVVYDDLTVNSLLKLAEVCVANSSGGMPRTSAMKRAVSQTKPGSLRLPRCGTGAR